MESITVEDLAAKRKQLEQELANGKIILEQLAVQAEDIKTRILWVEGALQLCNELLNPLAPDNVVSLTSEEQA